MAQQRHSRFFPFVCACSVGMRNVRENARAAFVCKREDVVALARLIPGGLAGGSKHFTHTARTFPNCGNEQVQTEPEVARDAKRANSRNPPWRRLSDLFGVRKNATGHLRRGRMKRFVLGGVALECPFGPRALFGAALRGPWGGRCSPRLRLLAEGVNK